MTQPLTIIMTSCDRWDLFTQTLDSFFKLNSYPYVAFHVHNYSVKVIPQEIKERYADKNITWHEGTKRGLSAAWDYLVDLVETEYFFNLEDDWLFEGNKNFIIESIFLIENYLINQVWIRDEKDHKHPLEFCMIDGCKYVLQWGDWCGFSFNPSVRSKKEWLNFFPYGVTRKDEIELSRMVMKRAYQAVSLVNYACRHIGNGRHTKDFKI
jgi:hypothetical protein